MKNKGTPPCPYRITVTLSCPVPGCMWTATEQGDSDLPLFRKTFAIHWNSEHFGQWHLLEGVDLSTLALKKSRLIKELDRITGENE